MSRDFLTTVQAVHGLPVSERAMGMAQLVVSELVTNARKYAPGPCLLDLEIVEGAVQISVWESSTTLPSIQAADPERVGQHGLEIAMAVSQTFCVQREPVGKQITAAIELADDPGGPGRTAALLTRARPAWRPLEDRLSRRASVVAGWGSGQRRDRLGRQVTLAGPGFAKLCAQRAGFRASGARSVAANGKVIEQAQILTTHNLATLVRQVGIAPEPGWEDLARRCFVTVCRLTARVHDHPRPLATIKDAAYAWRQMVFHLALCAPDEQASVLAWLDEESARHPAHATARLAPALAGLRLVAEGGSFAADGTADDGRARRFLGWSTDGHWLRADPGAGGARG